MTREIEAPRPVDEIARPFIGCVCLNSDGHHSSLCSGADLVKAIAAALRVERERAERAERMLARVETASRRLLARYDRTVDVHDEDYYLMVKKARADWEELRAALAPEPPR